MMKKAMAESIARRAAYLAVASVVDGIGTNFTEEEYYQEYVDQLLTGDYQSLRYWIGWRIEGGNKEAVEIMKMIIRAQLTECMDDKVRDIVAMQDKLSHCTEMEAKAMGLITEGQYQAAMDTLKYETPAAGTAGESR